jgi:tetratricopeptide (TPR) repeat protein
MTGIEHLEKFEPRKALPLLSRALKKELSYGNLINYAAALRGCGLIEHAQGILQQSLAMDQTKPEAWSNLGQCAEDLGQFEDCAAMFQRALQCIEASGVQPTVAGEPLLAFAYAMMRLGHFRYIWPVWEAARVNRSWWPFKGLHVWKGEPGARLLILPEGGFGDGFNFLRWLDKIPVAERTVLIWDSMYEYAKHTLERGATRVLPLSHRFQYDELQRYTHCAPYLSLMTGFNDWSDIPPPLNWEPRGRVIAPPEDQIGFCWRAEENGVMRKIRSLDHQAATRIAKHLFDNAGRVVSLCPAGKTLYRAGDETTPRNVVQDESLLTDFEQTARTILKCKLVVTVDTSVAHLAGSLGVPTLILLPMRSDWKWGLPPAETTAFYGRNVKLFRNDHPVDWRVDKIKEAIDGM